MATTAPPSSAGPRPSHADTDGRPPAAHSNAPTAARAAQHRVLDASGSRGLLWACYLGSSWTWVIGMFFPILLVADFGVWGWVAFAIPNVLGAAAMGWVLPSAETADRLVRRHRPVMTFFSLWTIAFQGMAAAWVCTTALEWNPLWAFGLTLAVAAGITALCQTPAYWTAVLGVTAWSWLLLAVALFQPWFMSQLDPDMSTTRQGPLALLWFIPGALAGFALCPYLDLTFQRARRETTPAVARVAFGVGFCGVFLSMILFALGYAGLLGDSYRGLATSPAGLLLVTLFVLPQVGLTVGLHTREGRAQGGITRGNGLAVLGVGALIGLVAANSADNPGGFFGAGEVIYRLFLLAYGTAFPAYVWICMVPTARPVPNHVKHACWSVATVLAVPAGYLGFITGPHWMSVLAIAIVVLARLPIGLPPRRFADWLNPPGRPLTPGAPTES